MARYKLNPKAVANEIQADQVQEATFEKANDGTTTITKTGGRVGIGNQYAEVRDFIVKHENGTVEIVRPNDFAELYCNEDGSPIEFDGDGWLVKPPTAKELPKPTPVDEPFTSPGAIIFGNPPTE